MWSSRIKFLALLVVLSGSCPGLDLRSHGEFFRPDPFGGTVECDREGAVVTPGIHMNSARRAYASFHLVASSTAPAQAELQIEFPFPAEVYREWFHLNAPDGKYYPDALIPVHGPSTRFQIPDPENRVPGQTAVAFWIDLWIPESAKPGVYRGEARISGGTERKAVPLEIRVLPQAVPEEDAVTLDNNSYGTSWMFEQYPGIRDEGALFRLIHAYHRTFYDHRGTFHQLGYGHAGKVGPEFAPELSGSGRNKHVASWDRFDRHYGPLLDGSAFRDSRRGPRPIPFAYLPINPEWPASFLWWGEPGYETEFVNVVSEMEKHFREKGWTHTKFEVFFNQKKRYKGFPWDGDEVRFERDNRYFVEYDRILRKALPAEMPVQFILRADTSWSMAHQFQELAGVIRFWVAGEGVLSWYPGAADWLKQRGDLVWTYGGTPSIQRVSTEVTLNPLRCWITGAQGFVRWQTVDPGPDPWFHFNGGGETLVYPGERFGIQAPLPSIRLKLQRDCLQDLALLERAAKTTSRDHIQQEIVSRFNGTQLSDWQNTPPAIPSKPVIDWTNADIGDALRPYEARFANLKPSAWTKVHELALAETERTQ